VHAANLRWREGANRRRGYIRIPPYTKREEDGGALDQKKNRRRTIRQPRYSLMSKRQTSNPGTVRKKRKGNTTWKTSSLDPSDDEKMTAEDVRVWDISTSENTGHMTARRKNLKHYSKALPPEGPSTRRKQGEVGEVACVEDAGILADSETVPQTTYKQRQKRKRVRTVKENDSVSDHSSLSSLNLPGFPDKDGTVASAPFNLSRRATPSRWCQGHSAPNALCVSWLYPIASTCGIPHPGLSR
jgi:hypothetical protein